MSALNLQLIYLNIQSTFVYTLQPSIRGTLKWSALHGRNIPNLTESTIRKPVQRPVATEVVKDIPHVKTKKKASKVRLKQKRSTYMYIIKDWKKKSVCI